MSQNTNTEDTIDLKELFFSLIAQWKLQFFLSITIYKKSIFKNYLRLKLLTSRSTPLSDRLIPIIKIIRITVQTVASKS